MNMDKRPLRIKVTGDVDQPATLRVTDALTGEPLKNVIDIDIHLSRVPDECRVTVTLLGAELDIETTATVIEESLS